MCANLDHVAPGRVLQIKKIVKYAKEFLNVDVKFVPNLSTAGLYTAPAGQRRALVEVLSTYNGLTIVLTLLHELGHHIDFLERGYVEVEEVAYNYYPHEVGAQTPIKYRKHIRNVENEANIHAWKIAKYLDLKIPIFAFVKDVLHQKEMMNYMFSHGPCPKKVRDKLRKKCHKKAKELLWQSENPMSQLWLIK